MLPFSWILAKKRAAQYMVFFSHEADGLSCTKQVPLVVDVRAATEGAVRERRQPGADGILRRDRMYYLTERTIVFCGPKY